MAHIYADEIISCRPQGSYILAGGSMGGLVALETARIIQERGKIVEKLILLDTFGPHYDVRKFGREKKNHLQNIKTSLYFKGKILLNKIRKVIFKAMGMPIPHAVRYFDIEMNNYHLIWNHQVHPYQGDMQLIRAPKAKVGWYADEFLGWKETILGELTIDEVDGDHHQFVESPEVAKKFGEIIS